MVLLPPSFPSDRGDVRGVGQLKIGSSAKYSLNLGFINCQTLLKRLTDKFISAPRAGDFLNFYNPPCSAFNIPLRINLFNLPFMLRAMGGAD